VLDSMTKRARVVEPQARKRTTVQEENTFRSPKKQQVFHPTLDEIRHYGWTVQYYARLYDTNTTYRKILNEFCVKNHMSTPTLDSCHLAMYELYQQDAM
jgi:hypothetical protein